MPRAGTQRNFAARGALPIPLPAQQLPIYPNSITCPPPPRHLLQKRVRVGKAEAHVIGVGEARIDLGAQVASKEDLPVLLLELLNARLDLGACSQVSATTTRRTRGTDGSASGVPEQATPPRLRERRSYAPQSPWSTRRAYRSPARARGPRRTGPSSSRARSCPRGKACTVRTTRACRTVRAGEWVRGVGKRGTGTDLGETGDGANDVGRLVHDDDGACSETRLQVLERVKVHPACVHGGQLSLALANDERLTKPARRGAWGGRGRNFRRG